MRCCSTAETCKIFEEHLDKILRAKEKLPPEETMLEAADFFDALGSTTRLKILLALMHGELCTCDLSNITGLSLSAVSHQLRVLKDRKLVAYRKEGRKVYYRLDDDHIKAILITALKHLGEH